MIAATELEGLRVLVVEDDALQAISYRDILADAGASIVGPFTSLKQAMKALESESCEVALVDYQLGDDTAAGLQARLENLGIPYLVITGNLRTMVRRGVDQTIIAKPVSPEFLCGIVAAKARHNVSPAHTSA